MKGENPSCLICASVGFPPLRSFGQHFNYGLTVCDKPKEICAVLHGNILRSYLFNRHALKNFGITDTPV